MVRGRKFCSADEAVEELRQLYVDLRQYMVFKCFESWFSRMHMCIGIGGIGDLGDILKSYK